ncbi:MAG: GntR family transcriptional regulator [Cellulosilyticum sp.]|nr:GntR family transcriptional regulator [Cellulosilyticum sp.]
MRINLDYTSSIPMYMQIKNAIKTNIYGGQLKDKEVLPSIRQLAKELNVSMITVKRAYTDLEYEGLVNTVSGRGTFVNVANYDLIIEHRKTELLMRLKESIHELKVAGINEEEIIQLVLEEYSMVGGK